jgi:hypothetical protein
MRYAKPELARLSFSRTAIRTAENCACVLRGGRPPFLYVADAKCF